MPDNFLETKNLTKHFQTNSFLKKGKVIQAVDGVSFHIARKEVFGLVGESGCGKSTVGRLLLGLLKPTTGQVYIKGLPIFKLPKKEMQILRREMQLIFQDPFSSLNPRLNVGDIIREPLDIHVQAPKTVKKKRVSELMELVGLNPDEAGRYPHEFSGGQRQRIGIARALALNPQFIVADEPVSSLDVSMRAQIL
ncbi:MAG: ATP-binding cassette domain-containing protein, partial [Dethiobacteria bacterium]